MLSCMIAGVGGQGTVLLSRLIGAAAIRAGLKVRGTETIGMAQRGGSVVSHVRMGEEIHSPLIPKGQADVIIAFEPGEAVRVLPFLKAGGTMIVCDRAVPSVVSSLSGDAYDAKEMTNYLKQAVPGCILINGEELIKKCGGAKALNVALLGTAVRSGVFPFKRDDVLETLKERIPGRFWEMNVNAFQIGERIAKRNRGDKNADD